MAPHTSVIVFSVVALLILIPGLFTTDVFKNMGTLYTFGSLLAFMFAHASVLSLRVRKLELPRPFRLGWNIKIGGRELPVTAILGLAATTIIWIIILITQPYSRWIGIIWMAIGLIVYYFLPAKAA